MHVSRRKILTGTLASLVSPYLSKSAFASTDTSSFHIGATTRDRPMSSHVLGLSFEKTRIMNPKGWFTIENSSRHAKLLSNLGRGIIRVGGNAVDRSSWRGANPDQPPIQPNSVDELAKFARAIDWKIIYGIKFYGNTVEAVIDEASYAISALGSSLFAIELGNEPSFYRGDNNRFVTFSDYMEAWTYFVAGIRKKFPDIAFVGPSTDRTWAWPVYFAERAPKNVWLAQHYYRGDSKLSTSTVEKLLSPDPDLVRLSSLLTMKAKTYGLNGAILDEVNSFTGGGAAGISDTFANALYLAYVCAETTYNGVHSINLHGGGANYDHIGYDKALGVKEIRPGYYGLKLFSLFRNSFYRDVEAISSSHDSVKCFANVDETGRNEKVFLINLNFNIDVECTISGLGKRSYDIVDLTAPDVIAKSGILLAGSAIDVDTDWQPRVVKKVSVSNGCLTLTVPKISAMVLT